MREGTMEQYLHDDVHVNLIRFFDTALAIAGLIFAGSIAVLMF